MNVLMAGYTSSEREAARAKWRLNKTIFCTTTRAKGGIADNYCSLRRRSRNNRYLPGVEYMVKKYGKRIYVLAADYGFGQVSAQWVRPAQG